MSRTYSPSCLGAECPMLETLRFGDGLPDQEQGCVIASVVLQEASITEAPAGMSMCPQEPTIRDSYLATDFLSRYFDQLDKVEQAERNNS